MVFYFSDESLIILKLNRQTSSETAVLFIFSSLCLRKRSIQFDICQIGIQENVEERQKRRRLEAAAFVDANL